MPRRWLHSAFVFLATLRALARARLSARDRVRDLARRAGFGLPRLERSIWVHGEGPGEFNGARLLLSQLVRLYPSHRLVLTTSCPMTVGRLAAQFPLAECR